MAQTPESLIKAQIRAILKKHNVYYAMPIGTGYGNSGVPDFLCCVNGLFIAIEAKSGNNKPTALQNKNIREIQDAGGIALVINEFNVADIEAHIKLARNIT
jgi:pantoate kinase